MDTPVAGAAWAAAGVCSRSAGAITAASSEAESASLRVVFPTSTRTRAVDEATIDVRSARGLHGRTVRFCSRNTAGASTRLLHVVCHIVASLGMPPETHAWISDDGLPKEDLQRWRLRVQPGAGARGGEQAGGFPASARPARCDQPEGVLRHQVRSTCQLTHPLCWSITQRGLRV